MKALYYELILALCYPVGHQNVTYQTIINIMLHTPPTHGQICICLVSGTSVSHDICS